MPPVLLALKVSGWAPVKPPENVQRPAPVEVKLFNALVSAKLLLMVNGLPLACEMLVRFVVVIGAEIVAPEVAELPDPLFVIDPVMATVPVAMVIGAFVPDP